MTAAARKGSRGLLRDFGEIVQLQISLKGPADFVSAADHRAEEVISSELKKARPDYGLVLEEGGIEIGSDASNRWLVDPLDGTTNFLHGIPQFCISIALERDSKLYAGVIYDPIRDEMFWAEDGCGAYVNDTRIRVAARKSVGDSVIVTGIPHRGRAGKEGYIDQIQAIMERASGIRRFGSAALDMAWVAAGRFDAYWEQGLKSWDLAAGAVLVREAGGIVSEVNGGEAMLNSGSILCANVDIHGQLVQIFSNSSN